MDLSSLRNLGEVQVGQIRIRAIYINLKLTANCQDSRVKSMTLCRQPLLWRSVYCLGVCLSVCLCLSTGPVAMMDAGGFFNLKLNTFCCLKFKGLLVVVLVKW